MGSDDSFIYFVTPSWSERGVEYDLTIDRRTGEVTCSCLDAQCRRKRPYIVDLLRGEHANACKHAVGLAVAHRRELEK